MRLLFDIGNTRIKWALEVDGKFSSAGACIASEFKPDEHLNKLSQLKHLDGAWASCVGPQRNVRKIRDWLETTFSLSLSLVSVTRHLGDIHNAYQDISKLGVDRWMAALGARAFIGSGDMIIIDAGTAITIDWLDTNNVFQGGAILPGPALMHDVLVGRTSGIESQFTLTSPVFGKTTTECVNSGVRFGAAGAVQRIVIEMQNQIRSERGLSGKGRPDERSTESISIKTVITGGDAGLIADHLETDVVFDEYLVLRGLLVAAQFRGG